MQIGVKCIKKLYGEQFETKYILNKCEKQDVKKSYATNKVHG
jgi:hypothetical protein